MRFFALVPVLLAVGCSPRLRGVEAFESSTTPVDYAANRAMPDAWKGDPYAFGGSAEASGGLNSRTTYGLGAKKGTSDPLDLKQIQPAKGIGQNPGDFPVYSDPAYGNTNAPFAQPRPGMVGPVGSGR